MLVDYVRVWTSDGPAVSTPMATTTGTPLAPVTSTRPDQMAPGGMGLQLAGFTEDLGFQLNGSARITEYRLDLASGREEAGSAWAKTLIEPSRSWGTSFAFEITDIADGVAFVLQTEGPGALGGHGGSLGYGHPSDGDARIAPSLAVEFDAWSNRPDGFDPATQHVGVTVDGDIAQHLAASDPGFSLHSGGPVYAWISYDASGHTLRVFASRSSTPPAQPLLTVPIDLAAQFGNAPLHVGFTGGTGIIPGSNARASIRTWSLLIEPIGGAQ